jgi:hypothetical protein
MAKGWTTAQCEIATNDELLFALQWACADRAYDKVRRIKNELRDHRGYDTWVLGRVEFGYITQSDAPAANEEARRQNDACTARMAEKNKAEQAAAAARAVERMNDAVAVALQPLGPLFEEASRTGRSLDLSAATVRAAVEAAYRAGIASWRTSSK